LSTTVNGDVWIVIAAYNEGRRLGDTLSGLCRHYANVAVVDDGSRDNTSAVAMRHPVWVLRHAINCGQGAALQTGIDFAVRHGAGILVTFDADGQHSPDDIPELLEPIRARLADVALGSRFLGKTVGLPWTRWLVLKLGVLFTRVFSRIRVTDTHNGLRALSRSAAQQIRITQNRMAHASEILDQIRQHGLRFCEVPVTIHYSQATLEKGQSSWNALRIVGQLLLGRFIR
jgi:glycosyltransferase involved in cell wall biosynthesis